MHKCLAGFAGTVLILLAMGQVQARNTPSSRPSEQPNPLPAFSPPAKTAPFVLPPVTEPPNTITTGHSLFLRRVIFKGNAVISEAELQKLATPFLRRTLDAGELEELRFQITQYYQKRGYINSGAIIPQQKITDQTLEIQLIEGRITEVTVSGNERLNPDYLRYRMSDPEAPLNTQQLQERYLLLLEDPLIQSINASLKPLANLGESALDLQVTRALPYQLAVHFNNYNPPSIGAEQMQVETWVRNLTGWGDKLDFRFDLSEGSTNYSGGLNMPLNRYGTLFDFHFETGQSSIIEEPLNKVNITSHVLNFNSTLSHPVYRDLNHSLILGASFANRRNQTEVLNLDYSFVQNLATGETKVSVLRFFQEYLGRFDAHVLAFRSTFSTGLNVFNPTIQPSQDLADSKYFAWLGQLQYAYKLLENGTLFRLRGNLQLSDQPLLAQEKIAIGGVFSVRGYRENELVRDQGYNGTIEFNIPVYKGESGFINQLALVPFMDYGSAWNHHQAADYLHSIGIGFNWQLTRHIKADFYYAHALNSPRPKPQHNLQDDGIYFNVSLFAF